MMNFYFLRVLVLAHSDKCCMYNAGCGVFSLLAFIPSTRHYFHSVRKAFYDSLAFQSVGKTLLGGAILGTGMTLSGSVSEPIKIYRQSSLYQL